MNIKNTVSGVAINKLCWESVGGAVYASVNDSVDPSCWNSVVLLVRHTVDNSIVTSVRNSVRSVLEGYEY
jgi:hypothetical protein